MRDIIADVERDGAIVASGKPFRLEYVGDMEMHVAGGYGAAPFYRYEGYSRGWLDLRQNDYLVNVQHIDPLTSQLAAWNVPTSGAAVSGKVYVMRAGGSTLIFAASGVPMVLQVINVPERMQSGRLEIKLDTARTTGFN